MKSLVVAVFAVLAVTQPLFAGQPEPTARPVGPAGKGLVAGFVEEPASFWVDSANGRFQVVIEPGGRAARKLIHDKRSKDFFGGKSLKAIQAEMNAKPNATPKNSVFIGIAEDGDLVGANKRFGNQGGDSIDSYRNYAYPLNDNGETRKVILSGGSRDNEPALFVRLHDSSGKERVWMILTAIDTVIVGMDFH